MAKDKNRTGKPERKNFHQRNIPAEINTTATLSKNSKTCPGKKRGCNYLGRKDTCSILGAKCNV